MPPSIAKYHAPPEPRFRWAAVFCALLVLALGLLVASPQLHATLHTDSDHQDHTCAVTLFGHGAEKLAGDVCLVNAPVLYPAGPSAFAPALPETAPPHRLPPGCGPPLC